jgi:hypothetical protein
MFNRLTTLAAGACAIACSVFVYAPASAQQMTAKAGPTEECYHALILDKEFLRLDEYDKEILWASMTENEKSSVKQEAGASYEQYKGSWYDNRSREQQKTEQYLTDREHKKNLAWARQQLTTVATDAYKACIQSKAETGAYASYIGTSASLVQVNVVFKTRPDDVTVRKLKVQETGGLRLAPNGPKDIEELRNGFNIVYTFIRDSSQESAVLFHIMDAAGNFSQTLTVPLLLAEPPAYVRRSGTVMTRSKTVYVNFQQTPSFVKVCVTPQHAGGRLDKSVVTPVWTKQFGAGEFGHNFQKYAQTNNQKIVCADVFCRMGAANCAGNGYFEVREDYVVEELYKRKIIN